MTDYEKKVMRNIIYAVETGGQVYGNQDYGAFTEAYTNTSNEKAITIGAGQWYGVQAQNLLRVIRSANTSAFRRLDTAGISSDIDTADWSTYSILKSSAKANCIVAIIKSEIGKQCQDKLVDEQIELYIKEIGELGVTGMDAKMMCANFRHQGGTTAVMRILAKTTKPYSLEKLYASCQSDTGNQVGAYKNRQKMVYGALKKYISGNEVTAKSAIEAMIRVAKDEVGYLEKASNAYLDSKTKNAGDANFTKYWRDVKPEWNGSYWCACFVTWVYVNAFGKTTASALLRHYPYVYVQTLSELYRNFSNPQVGDIVMYHDGTRFNHTGLVIEVSGDQFVTIEGNTSPDDGINPNGGGVYRKERYISLLPRTKFVRPDYSVVSNINSGGSGETSYQNDLWQPTEMATCTGDVVNVRQSPGGTIIGSLPRGSRFEVDGKKLGKWVHVKVSGIGIGYMHQDYVGYGENSAGTSNIKLAQSTLNACFNENLVADGLWGGASNTALIRAIQTALNNEYNAGLIVDGIWGTNTANACGTYLLRKGDNNLYVKVLQIGLYRHNIALSNGIDGDFGASTDQGVKAFQENYGLIVDGIVGRDTIMALIKIY